MHSWRAFLIQWPASPLAVSQISMVSQNPPLAMTPSCWPPTSLTSDRSVHGTVKLQQGIPDQG